MQQVTMERTELMEQQAQQELTEQMEQLELLVQQEQQVQTLALADLHITLAKPLMAE